MIQIGALLVRDGLCSPADVKAALESQKLFGGRLGTSLVENGAIEVDVLATALARQRGMPAALLRHFKMVDAAALKRIPKKLAEKYRVIPIGAPPAAPTALAIAIVEPLSPQAFDDIAFAAGARLIPMIAPEIRIFQALEKFYGVANADGGMFLRMGNAGRRRRAQVAAGELRSIPPPPPAPLSMPKPPVASLDMPAWPSRPPPAPEISNAKIPAAAAVASVTPRSIPAAISRTAPTGHTEAPSPMRAPPRVSNPAAEPPASDALSTPRPTHLAANDDPSDEAMLEIVGPVSAASDALMFSKTMPAFDRPNLPTSAATPKTREAVSSGEAFDVTVDLEKFSAQDASDDLFMETMRIPESLFAPTERLMVAATPAIETWVSGHDSSPDRSNVDPALDVLDAIAHATKQDEVGDALTGYLRARFEVGLLLLVDGHAARGWRGFTLGDRSTPDAQAIAKITIDVSDSGLLRKACATRRLTHAAPDADDPVDRDRLWRRLRCEAPSDAVVAPIVARDRVVALIVALALDGAMIGDAAVDEIASRAQAASVAWTALAVSTR